MGFAQAVIFDIAVFFSCFLELKGSTLPQMSGDKSLLWCEVFFIPPMPEDVEMPPQPVVGHQKERNLAPAHCSSLRQRSFSGVSFAE